MKPATFWGGRFLLPKTFSEFFRGWRTCWCGLCWRITTTTCAASRAIQAVLQALKIEQERRVAWHKDELHIASELLNIAPLDKLRVLLKLGVNQAEGIGISRSAQFNGLGITFCHRHRRICLTLCRSYRRIRLTFCQRADTSSVLQGLFGLLLCDLFRLDSLDIFVAEGDIAQQKVL